MRKWFERFLKRQRIKRALRELEQIGIKGSDANRIRWHEGFSIQEHSRRKERLLKAFGSTMTDKERLKQIASIIDDVDQRCLVYDGPVGDTREEMTKEEMCQIYKLAKGL